MNRINLKRPITPLIEFESAILKASLTDTEKLIIEHIRLVGSFTQPSIRKALGLASKPPMLSILCKASRKIGHLIPNHFEQIREWSKQMSVDKVHWDGDLVCSACWSIDGIRLCPEEKTALYHNFAVHKELFNGL